MPTINVQMPDGQVVSFPEGTADDTINTALADFTKPPPTWFDQLESSAQKGLDLVSPITSIPGQMAEKAKSLVSPFIPQSIKEAWKTPTIPNLFQEDPGENVDKFPALTPEQLAAEQQNLSGLPMPLAGAPPGVAGQPIRMYPPGGEPKPGAIEKALPYVGAPLAIASEVESGLSSPQGAGMLMAFLADPAAAETAIPGIRAAILAEMAKEAPKNVAQRFEEAGKSGSPADVLKATLGGLVDLLTPVFGQKTAFKTPEVAPTGALPTENPSGAAALLPPEAGPNYPRQTRFSVSPSGQMVDLSQLSPAEQAELLRGPREFVPRRTTTTGAAQPPIIGQRPITIEQPIVTPGGAQAPGGGLVVPEVPSAPKEVAGGKLPTGGQEFPGQEPVPGFLQTAEQRIAARQEPVPTEVPQEVIESGALKKAEDLLRERLAKRDMLGAVKLLQDQPANITRALVDKVLGVGKDKVPLSAAQATIFNEIWNREVERKTGQPPPPGTTFAMGGADLTAINKELIERLKYARGVREDERQVQEGGVIPPGGEAKGSPNLEQPTPQQPGGATPEGAKEGQVLLKPEVVKQAAPGTSNRQNKFGDEYGTTYRASPGDWQNWQDVQKRFQEALGQKDFNALPKIGKELEDIKNKYGGMPPEPPVVGQAAPAVTQVEQEISQYLQDNIVPDFKDLTKKVSKKFGDVKPGQLRDAYQDRVWGRLMSSLGNELQNALKAMGLSRKEGGGKIMDPLTDEQAKAMEGLSLDDKKAINEDLSKRYSAIAAIGNKLIRAAQEGRKRFQRDEVSSDDVANPEPRHKQPVYQHFNPQDANDVPALGEALTADARAFGGAKYKKLVDGKLQEVKQPGLPISVTKRLTAIQNKTTGKVSLVSTFKDGRRGPVMLDPQHPGKQHMPVGDMLNRYRVLASVLLDEPVQSFEQSFDNISQYEKDFGAPARESISKAAGYERPEPGEQAVPEPHVKPMMESDAKSIMDHIKGEVGRIESMDDVRQGLMGLQDSPKYRATIMALRKLGQEINSKETAVSPEQYLDNIAKVIYDNFSKAKTEQEFLDRTVESGGGEVSKAPGLPTETKGPKPGTKVTLGGLDFELLKNLTAERWEDLSRTVGASMLRGDTERDLAGSMDRVFNTAAEMGNQAENAIRESLGTTGVKTKRSATLPELNAATMMTQGKFDPKVLQDMSNRAANGITKAAAMASSLNPRQRAIGRAWLKAATDVKNAVDHALNDFANPDLQRISKSVKKELDDSFNRAKNSGLTTDYWEGYVPGRYEGEFFTDNQVSFPGVGKMSILGKNWRNPKTFPSYAHAIEAGPYIPVTLDASVLTGHSVRQVMNRIGSRMWRDSLAAITDPDTGLPIARDPIRRPNGEMGTRRPEDELVTINGKTLSVSKAFAGLVNDLTRPSAIQRFWATRLSLELGQRLKHTILAGDFFHLFRMAYYSMATTGGKPRYKGPLSVLEFREGDIPKAVSTGRITPEEAAWGAEQIPVKDPTGGTTMMSRRQIADGLQKNFLNVGKIQDAIYKELVGKVPGFSTYNRWLFDKFTRGVMLNSAVENFEALNKKHPTIPAERLMKDVARDTNAFFANLGRQGVFKSETMRDLMRIGFLSPQWVEGLVRKEVGFASRVTGLSKALEAAGVSTGRKGMPVLGTLGAGVGRGLVAMIALTQVLNLISRRQPTWQNPESDHKFDAYIPMGKFGSWLSPLAVFNELTHDLLRYNESKEKSIDALMQIGENKLSPYGRLAFLAATSKSGTGEHITTTPGLAWEAARQAAPLPISVGRYAQYAGSKLFPGTIAAPPPGSVARQSLATLGLKAQPAQSPVTQVSRAAQRFMVEKKLKPDTGWMQEQTDQPSYSKLRSALRNEDYGTAKVLLNYLRQSHTDKQIYRAMASWAKRPFTGSKRGEMQFLNSLTPEQLKAYQDAELIRQKEYNSFVDWFVKMPPANAPSGSVR